MNQEERDIIEKEYLKKKDHLDLFLKKYQVELKDVTNALMAGFDIAATCGPLCEEPMLGACFIVEDIEYIEDLEENKTPQKAQISSLQHIEEEKESQPLSEEQASKIEGA